MLGWSLVGWLAGERAGWGALPPSPPSVCVVQMSVRTSVLDLFHSVLLYRSLSHPSRPRFTTPLAPVYLARPHATTSRFPRDWVIV